MKLSNLIAAMLVRAEVVPFGPRRAIYSAHHGMSPDMHQ